MRDRVLVRIDCQYDFVDPEGALTINNPDFIYQHQRFCENLQKGMFSRIIDAADTHFVETYQNTREAEDYPLHTVYYSWGWQKIADFKDNIPVTDIYKSTTNLWNEEKTYGILQQDWRLKDVYLCGLLSDVCVRQAMDGFLRRGAKVVLLEDLCRGAQKQMPEIVAEAQYANALAGGRLQMITSKQFFRQVLNEKKRFFNFVNKNSGEAR